MKKSKFSESQIVAILKEADAGILVKDICRKHGISSPTYLSLANSPFRPPWATGIARDNAFSIGICSC